ncbi:MAG TPA: hypothetical protein VI488_05205 [Candidatus Angelobacter sp.]
MNCQQFQEVLPYIIESGGNADEEGHLRTCPACAELVEDLQYIAQQAKLMLPMHDPSPRVWAGIEDSLHRQGLIQEGRTSLLGHITILPTQVRSWTPLGAAMALFALAAFSWLLINYRAQLPPAPAAAQNISSQPTSMESDDQQLITRVSQQAPDVRRAYEDSLREVNAYIVDAQQAVDQDPEDAAARASLLEAHQQKEMLYQMATVRSLP